jgi:hypothetical protein
MKKGFIHIVALLVWSAAIVQNAEAQKLNLGIRAGFNSSNWHGATKDYASDLLATSERLSISDRQGFHAGVFYELSITPKLKFQPGLSYSQKGLKFTYRQPVFNFLTVNANIINQAHYVDLPLQLRYNVNKNFFLIGGGQVSYLFSNQVRGELQALGFEVGHNFDFNSPFRKWDAAVIAGAGAEFSNFQLSAGYEFGLVSVDRTFDAGLNNRVIKIGLGYKF